MESIPRLVYFKWVPEIFVLTRLLLIREDCYSFTAVLNLLMIDLLDALAIYYLIHELANFLLQHLSHPRDFSCSLMDII